MASRCLQGQSPTGLDSVLLQNDRFLITIVPAAGGKLLTLTDRRSGRNWLWQNPHLPLRQPATDDNFGRDLDSGGWDEVLFSVTPDAVDYNGCRIDAIPDHGDLLSADWQVDTLESPAGGELLCTMSATGQAADYHFTRSIRVHPHRAAIEFDYRFVNSDSQPLPFFWCSHPLLAVESGATIQIDGNPRLRIEDSATRAQCIEPPWHWPEVQQSDGTLLDFSASFAANAVAQRQAHKIFVRTPPSGAAALVLASGEQLTLRCDPAELPWLGVWINNGAWSGCGSAPYVNLGIEPATTPYDSVSEAIANDAVSWVAPGDERRWSLVLEF